MMDYIIPIGLAIGSAIIGSIGYMIRNIFQRITALEKFPAVTENQVRCIVSDKVDPVKEDVSEIRKSTDYLLTRIDYLLSLIYTSKQ